MWKTLNLIPDCSISLDFSFAQIVSRLQVQPELRGGVQANGKPERYIGANAARLESCLTHQAKQGGPLRLRAALGEFLA